MAGRNIKVTWGGNRHDIKVEDTDQAFQNLENSVRDYADGHIVAVTISGRHDWGYGIPVEESGYDLKVRVWDRKPRGPPLKWIMPKSVLLAQYEVRLDFRKQTSEHIWYEHGVSQQATSVAQDFQSRFSDLGFKLHLKTA